MVSTPHQAQTRRRHSEEVTPRSKRPKGVKEGACQGKGKGFGGGYGGTSYTSFISIGFRCIALSFINALNSRYSTRHIMALPCT